MDSILTSIKKLLGITKECTSFDPDLIIHIKLQAILRQSHLNSLNRLFSAIPESKKCITARFTQVEDSFNLVNMQGMMNTEIIPISKFESLYWSTEINAFVFGNHIVLI